MPGDSQRASRCEGGKRLSWAAVECPQSDLLLLTLLQVPANTEA